VKISEMKTILKQMKEICNYKDSETEISVRTTTYDPVNYAEGVSIRTKINGITVALDKALDKKQNTKDCRYIAIP